MTSEALLQLARASGIVAIALTLLLALVIGLLRIVAELRKQREERLLDVWLPIFHHVIEGLPVPDLPSLPARDRDVILVLWLMYFRSLRGLARDHLVRLAHILGLAEHARTLLRHRATRQRVLGVIALGQLADGTMRTAIERLVDDENPLLSLLAASAMLHIDADWAVSALLSRIGRREDWHISRIIAMIKETDPAVVAPHLRAALRTASPDTLPRLLPLIEIIHLDELWPLFEPLLDPRQPAEILIAALKVVQDPRALVAVRALVAHPRWEVRAMAARALGRLGGPSDQNSLLVLLGDPVWWVRYRAAHALIAFPFVKRETLVRLADGQSDRYAHDALQQALAEAAP